VSPAGPSRKQARRDALFLLYQREVTGRPLAELVDGHRLREGYPPDEFTIDVVGGVMERQDELDATLSSHSTNWPLERLAPLERSVLRLALFEFESGLTPPEVAIDEAVRLTRRYATDEAGALVNGILGAIAREGVPEAGASARVEPAPAAAESAPAPSDDDERQDDG
jgi:N utilization substance protein B